MRLFKWAEKTWRRNKRTRHAIEELAGPLVLAAVERQVTEAVEKHTGGRFDKEVTDAITADIMAGINKALKGERN